MITGLGMNMIILKIIALLTMIIIFITIMDSWCFMGQGTSMILIEIIAILTMTIIVTIISASWWFMGLGTTMCTSNTQCCFPKLLSIIKSSSGTFHQPKCCHQILSSNMEFSASLYPSRCTELLYYGKSAL